MLKSNENLDWKWKSNEKLNWRWKSNEKLNWKWNSNEIQVKLKVKVKTMISLGHPVADEYH